jgi:hypothetical protein
MHVQQVPLQWLRYQDFSAKRAIGSFFRPAVSDRGVHGSMARYGRNETKGKKI